MFGTKKEIGFERLEVCPHCKGMGIASKLKACPECKGASQFKINRHLSVKVPAGVDAGSKIRITGEGDAGIFGGHPGDLYVALEVLPHPLFIRDGYNLLFDLPLDISQAIHGTKVEIPTLYGSEWLQIPPDTQNNHEFRLQGKGVPFLKSDGIGDLLVRLRTVQYEAKKLSDEEIQETLEEIRHNQVVIKTYKKRLRVLEVQIAQFGMHTPPHLQVEIDDIQDKIQERSQSIEKLNRKLN